MGSLESYKNILNYTTCNEDSMTEIKALNIVATDTVLCVTGSGGRVLNLLTQNLKKIVAIDFNPIQNWLLELKIAAIKNLDYDQYVNFLGLNKCSERIKVFEAIKHDLSKDSCEYWENNIRIISRGIIYQGRFEKQLKYMSSMIKGSNSDQVSKMFNFSDLEKQQAFYEKEWDRSFWENNSDLEFSKYNDPALHLYLDYDYKIDTFIEMMDKSLKTHLLKDNHFLSLLIDGSYQRVKNLPLCLQERYFDKIKRSIDKVEIKTGNIVAYLQQYSEYFDKFSLSDVQGYLPEEGFYELYQSVINAATRNSIVCARSGIFSRTVPTELENIIKRNFELERKLQKEDLTSFFYKIIVASIKTNEL